MNKLIVSGVLIGVLGLGSGCTPRMFGTVATAAVFTAAVIGTAHVLADHDAHYHYDHCGHRRRLHEGHWVYEYHGYWEYYDPHADVWYYYE